MNNCIWQYWYLKKILLVFLDSSTILQRDRSNGKGFKETQNQVFRRPAKGEFSFLWFRVAVKAF